MARGQKEASYILLLPDLNLVFVDIVFEFLIASPIGQETLDQEPIADGPNGKHQGCNRKGLAGHLQKAAEEPN